jgi:ubiquitin-conjugating enzyme E2 Z
LEEYLDIQKAEKSQEEPPVYVYDAQADVDSNSSEPLFEPFKDLCKRRFLWYYDSYLQTIEKGCTEFKVGQKFEKMPFEGGNNSMEGNFQYPDLKRRLETIRAALHEEVNTWAQEGLLAVQKELGIAANLQRQYEQIVEYFKRTETVALSVELLDNNPFTWQLVLIGRPMTNLDGGLFQIKMNFSTRFPDEQPRVKFMTPMFHLRVSKDGILCYIPQRIDDVKSHIDAIMAAVEEESPAYDPRTLVNPEAAKLFWGSADDRKTYNRRLRQSVQSSSE